MNIHDAIKEHPNLMNNYRRAALCFVLAGDMADRGEYGKRRDQYICRGGMYLGMAQGWLFKKYGVVVNAVDFVNGLTVKMTTIKGTVKFADTI